MRQPLVIKSEADLADTLSTQRSSLQVIAIDGGLGTGKSSLARRLAAKLDCPVIECALFIRDGTVPYPANLDLECLGEAISIAKQRSRLVIVEGIMLQLVLGALNLTQLLNIYIKRISSDGVLMDAEFFDSSETEVDLIAKENEVCRFAGIPDGCPVLHRQLIAYHKKRAPHQHANLLYEACF